MWRNATIILAGAASIAAAPVRNVSDLGWLSGSWVSETKEGWTEEVWTSARGDMMLGTNRSGKGGKASAFEFMRIAPDGLGRISFWASPGGKTAVQFPMTSSKAGEVVFENPTNDYPTKILYRRKGEMLSATISGPEGKNPYSWTFRKL
jgi:hypothetical protein